jgi:CRP/FNR family transcriptional regulator
MSEMADALRRVPLFSELSTRDLRRLAEAMHERTFTDGQSVMSEGEGGVGFFVILEGRAAVTRGGEAAAELRAGDYFGEMALIDGNHRTATVRAVGDLRCAAMTQWQFRPFVKDHPDVAWALLTTVVKRVRAAQAAPAVTTG